MPARVSLRAVVDALDVLPDEWRAFLNPSTGEVYDFSEEDAEEVEDAESEEEGDADGDLPAWQREHLARVREILDSSDWVELPGKFELNEWEIMAAFSRSVASSELRDELMQAIHGRGAFRYFKDTIHRHGVQDEWYRYRGQAVAEFARRWLDDAGVSYEDDLDSPADLR